MVHWPEHVAAGEAFVSIWEVDDQGRRLSSTVTTQKADADGKFEIHYDPVQHIGGVMMMQLLPFYDDGALRTLRDFQEQVYQSLR